MAKHEIDLRRYSTEGVKLLSLRPRGLEVRDAAGLNEIDRELRTDPEATVVIKIPNYIVRITSSFFLGMLGDSIRNLESYEGFQERFTFEGHYSEKALRSAASEALKWGSVFV